MLLKNDVEIYFQHNAYNLSDYVNSLSKFLSVSPKDLIKNIQLPAEIIRLKDNFYDTFEVNTNNTIVAEKILDDFSKKFKELIHANNHTMPLSYKILDFFTRKIQKTVGNEKTYAQRKADEKLDSLATLRFWPIGN